MSKPLAKPIEDRTCAILNPRAGGWKRVSGWTQESDLEKLVSEWLAPDGPDQIGIKVMRKAKDGDLLTRQALQEGYSTVVAVGGDGTINDVLQALCESESNAKARLGLIPMGTANVLSRALDIPVNNPMRAASIVREGIEQRIDLGRAGGQWFALVAGIGFDGAVTQAVNRRWKRLVGRTAYATAAARVALSYPRCRVSLVLDEMERREYDAYLVLIANGGRYGGSFRLSQEVRLDDGMLDIFVCLRRSPLIRSVLVNGLALLRERLTKSAGVIHFRARTVYVEADTSIPVQLDGDTVGTTPIKIEVVPMALRVMTPHKL